MTLRSGAIGEKKPFVDRIPYGLDIHVGSICDLLHFPLVIFFFNVL